MIRQRLPDIAIIVLLFILPLAFFFRQTLGGQTLLPTENLYQYLPYSVYREVVKAPENPHNHLVSDLILENYPWKWFIRNQLSQGEIPLWNPYQFSGIPFLAAGQHSALYPVSLLYYLLDLPSAYGWYTVVNLWLAGVFMYAFVRSISVGRTGAVLAAVIYQFNGFVVASIVFQMMIGGFVWLPLVLMMAEYLIQGRPLAGAGPSPIPPIVVGAFGIGMNILAGHVEITLYTLLILAYYAGIRLIWAAQQIRRTPWTRNSVFLNFILQKGIYLAIMVVLGLGIGAIQLIPLFEFVQTSWRAERSDLQTVLSYAHPVRDVLQFVMPNFYGSPAHHSYFDVFTGQMATELKNAAGEPVHHLEWGIKNYVEGALYLGILPLLLALYTLLPHRRPPRQSGEGVNAPASVQGGNGTGIYRFIFASLSIISLLFMFGAPVYALLYALPGFNQLNSPFRWIYVLTMGVAALAAFGLDKLFPPGLLPDSSVDREGAAPPSLRAGRGSGGGVDKTRHRVGYVVTAAGLLVLAGLFLSRLFYPQLESVIDRVFQSMAKASEAFQDVRAFYSYEFVNVLIFGIMLTLAGGVFIASHPRPFSRSPKDAFVADEGVPSLSLRAGKESGGGVLAGLAIALVIADLWLASWNFNPASDPLLLDFKPPAVQFLQNKQAAGEVFRYTTLIDPTRPAADILNANSGWRYGLEDIRGYDSIIPRPYVEYMRQLAPQVQLDFNRIAPLYTVYPPGIDFDYRTALQSPLLHLLNVRYVLTQKHIDIAGEGYTLVHEDEAVRIWENPAAVPRAYLVNASDFAETWLTPPGQLPSPPTLLPGGAGKSVTEVRISRSTGREKFLDVTLESVSWLIISENWSDGWRAFVRPQGTGEEAEKDCPVQRILGIFQGVQLPAGNWTVRLVYSPASFQVGLFGSLISVALGTLLMGLWLWRLFVGTNTESSSTTARVARNSIAPIILNLFNRGIDFAFLLVMLRLLSPEDVGTYYYLVVVFVWFDIFSNFGLDLFLIREIARDRARAGHYFFNITLLRLLLCVIGIVLLAGYLFIRQTTITPALSDTALLTMVLLYAGLFPASLSKGMSSLFYAYEQAEKPAAIATITTINKAIFGVMALLLGYGIVGLAAVSIVNNIITLVVLVWTGRHLIAGDSVQAGFKPAAASGFRLDIPLLKNMTQESLPLLLNHFLATIFFQIDVIILEAFKGAVVVAQYSVAYRWILAINIIPSFFTQALLPVMSRQAKEDTAALQRTYSLGIKLLFALAVPLAIGFTALAVPLTYLMGGSQYLPHGAIAIQLMIWSIPIGWMNSLTQYGLVALDLQRSITRAFFVAVAFNIFTNTLLIPVFSYPAAAVTTIASELVLLIPFALLMHQGLKTRLNWFGFLWRPAAAGVVMAVITFIGWPIIPFVPLIIGSGVYVAVWLALRPLNQAEMAILSRILPERLRKRFGPETRT